MLLTQRAQQLLPIYWLWLFADEIAGRVLKCHLYDFDQFVKSEAVGVVQVRVNTIPMNEPLSIQKPIDRCTEDEHTHDKVKPA